jgi:hypothetical protein
MLALASAALAPHCRAPAGCAGPAPGLLPLCTHCGAAYACPRAAVTSLLCGIATCGIAGFPAGWTCGTTPVSQKFPLAPPTFAGDPRSRWGPRRRSPTRRPHTTPSKPSAAHAAAGKPTAHERPANRLRRQEPPPRRPRPAERERSPRRPASRHPPSPRRQALRPAPKAKPSPAANAQGHSSPESSAPAGALHHKLVRATAALKKDFAKLQSSLRKLRGQGTESFDALYELVGQILASDPPLYVGGGYKTKEAFIAAELPGETLRSVQRNVLVARCFSPEEEAKHGIAFLEEVALYTKELTAAEQPPPAIHLDKLTLTLPGKAGATLRKKASAATIDDVRQARRSLRKGAATRRDASPIETALRAALGEQKALSAVTVRATKDHAAFGNVPVAELASFAKAVGKAKLPPS